MAVSESKNVLFRYNSENQNTNSELAIFHARPTDATRSKKTYQQRKTEHERILIDLDKPLHDKEEIYQIFCDELNDVYDLVGFLTRCHTFRPYINRKDKSVNYDERFAEYCFAKLASLCTHEPEMCAYVNALLSENTGIALTEETNPIKKAKIQTGQNVLKEMIQSLGKEKFFATLHAEHESKKNSALLSAPTPEKSNTIDVSDFLLRIQRPLGRAYVKDQHQDFYTQQNSLAKTAETIEEAIKTIHLFSWDSLNREQKFIKKIIDALQNKSESITIACGIGLKRQSFTFNNRNELLVCIRSNPSLCAEFKKALKESKKQRGMFSFSKSAESNILPSGSDQSEMFNATDEAFAKHAINLVPLLKQSLSIHNDDIASQVSETESLPTEQNDTVGENTANPHSTALVNLSGQFGSFPQTTPIADAALDISTKILRSMLPALKTPSLLNLQQYFRPADFLMRHLSSTLFVAPKPPIEAPLLLIKDATETKEIDNNPTIQHQAVNHHLPDLINKAIVDPTANRSSIALANFSGQFGSFPQTTPIADAALNISKKLLRNSVDVLKNGPSLSLNLQPYVMLANLFLPTISRPLFAVPKPPIEDPHLLIKDSTETTEIDQDLLNNKQLDNPEPLLPEYKIFPTGNDPDSDYDSSESEHENNDPNIQPFADHIIDPDENYSDSESDDGSYSESASVFYPDDEDDEDNENNEDDEDNQEGIDNLPYEGLTQSRLQHFSRQHQQKHDDEDDPMPTIITTEEPSVMSKILTFVLG